MPHDDVGGLEPFTNIAHDLATQPDLRQTMLRLVEISRELTGCDIAALWELKFGARPALLACTDEEFGRAISQLYNAVDEGPVRQALQGRTSCLVGDLHDETRWPSYLAAVRQRELPIRSVLALSLDLGERDLGALVLYSNRPGFFTDEVVSVAAGLADHAVLALDAANSAHVASNLRKALDSNRRVGIAIGILMALHQITDRQAFAMLRDASQRGHVKLRDLAEDVVLTGALPGCPTQRPAA